MAITTQEALELWQGFRFLASRTTGRRRQLMHRLVSTLHDMPREGWDWLLEHADLAELLVASGWGRKEAEVVSAHCTLVTNRLRLGWHDPQTVHTHPKRFLRGLLEIRAAQDKRTEDIARREGVSTSFSADKSVGTLPAEETEQEGEQT